MNEKKLVEDGWVEKKEYWIRKGEFGTWLMTKTDGSEDRKNINLNKKKDGAQ